eukprot:163810-Pyramimonas_sp.AAC.1
MGFISPMSLLNLSDSPRWRAFPGPITEGQRKQFRTSTQRGISTLTCSGITVTAPSWTATANVVDQGVEAHELEEVRASCDCHR